MKPLIHAHRGGVLVVVLVFILLAGALVSGWITIMNAQLGYVAESFTATQRRIASNNATALARQYLLSNLMTKAGSAAAAADVGGGWGSVSIPAWTVAPLSTFQKSGGFNHFSPGNGEGYTQDVPVSMTGGTASFTRVFQLRSGSSILSGTLTILNAPATSITGSMASSGRTMLWLPDGTFSLASGAYAVPSLPGSALSGASGSIAPSNFPFPPLSGSEISGVPNFDGLLNVVGNTSGINSLAMIASTSAPNGVQTVTGNASSNSNGVSSDGAGTITITLLDPTLGNVIISGGMTHLRLIGQTSNADLTAAGNAAAVLILVYQISPASNLADVTFENANNRKVVLALKTPSGLGTAFNFPNAGSGSWRSIMILETTPVTFSLTGGATQPIYGGIQSDRAISVGSGVLTVAAEPDPKLLERLCPREGWIEAYTQ